MKTETNAADLMNFLAILTVVAACNDDREDAEDTANFCWLSATSPLPGAMHLPDGRVLTWS